MSTDPRERLMSREFVTLAASTALFFGAMGAVNPILPKFVVDSLHGSDTTVGVVTGSFAVASLATRSLFGRLGGRRGSRVLVVIGGGIGALAMLVLAVSNSLVLTVVGRLLHGTAQAAVMTGSTVLAIDLAPEKRRGEAASYIFVSFHLGLGLGPVLGEAVLAHGSYHRVFAWLTGLMVAGAVVALFLPYRPGHPGAPPSPLIHRNALVPGTVVALGMVGFVAFSTFVPLYGREIGMNHIGPVFVVASISIAVVRVVFGKLPDRLGPVRATSIALALTVAGAVLVSVWGAAVGVYLAAGVFAGGLALQTPSLIPVAVHGVAPHERAAAMSTFTMFMDLSSALTGPLFGVIASGVGYRATFLTTGVCAVAAAVVLHRSLAPRWRAVTATSAVPSAVTR